MWFLKISSCWWFEPTVFFSSHHHNPFSCLLVSRFQRSTSCHLAWTVNLSLLIGDRPSGCMDTYCSEASSNWGHAPLPHHTSGLATVDSCVHCLKLLSLALMVCVSAFCCTLISWDLVRPTRPYFGDKSHGQVGPSGPDWLGPPVLSSVCRYIHIRMYVHV